MRSGLIFCTVIFLFISEKIKSQGEVCLSSDSVFCIPGVLGKASTKVFEIEYENTFGHNITSLSRINDLQSGSGEISYSKRLAIKAKLPIYLKDHLKIALGLHYKYEDFHFSDPENTLGFYQSLDGRNLKNIGATLYIIKSFRGNTFFMTRISASFNGDYKLSEFADSRYLKMAISPMIGWKLNARTSLGFGLSYGYNFGKVSLLPFAVFNKTFNDKWGIESIIPVKFRVRYNHNDKTVLSVGAEYRGASYSIGLDHPALENYDHLQLRKSDILVNIQLDRQLGKYLWCNFSIGVRNNLGFNLTDGNVRNPQTLVSSLPQRSIYFKTSIYLSPPKKR